MNTAVRRLVVVYDLLHLVSREGHLVAHAQEEAALELIFGDDVAAELVMVAEELRRADAVLVDGDLDLGKDLVELTVLIRLQGG